MTPDRSWDVHSCHPGRKEGRRYYICEAFTIYKNIQQPKNTLIIIIIIISLSVLPSMFRRFSNVIIPSIHEL